MENLSSANYGIVLKSFTQPSAGVNYTPDAAPLAPVQQVSLHQQYLQQQQHLQQQHMQAAAAAAAAMAKATARAPAKAPLPTVQLATGTGLTSMRAQQGLGVNGGGGANQSSVDDFLSLVQNGDIPAVKDPVLGNIMQKSNTQAGNVLQMELFLQNQQLERNKLAIFQQQQLRAMGLGMLNSAAPAMGASPASKIALQAAQQQRRGGALQTAEQQMMMGGVMAPPAAFPLPAAVPLPAAAPLPSVDDTRKRPAEEISPSAVVSDGGLDSLLAAMPGQEAKVAKREDPQREEPL